MGRSNQCGAYLHKFGTFSLSSCDHEPEWLFGAHFMLNSFGVNLVFIFVHVSNNPIQDPEENENLAKGDTVENQFYSSAAFSYNISPNYLDPNTVRLTANLSLVITAKSGQFSLSYALQATEAGEGA